MSDDPGYYERQDIRSDIDWLKDRVRTLEYSLDELKRDLHHLYAELQRALAEHCNDAGSHRVPYGTEEE